MEQTTSTRVSIPEITESQEWILPVDVRDHERLQGLNGTPRASAWAPLRVVMLREDEGRKFQRVDLPWVGTHALVLRERAMEAAREALAPAGEFLALESVDDSEPLWLFNVCRVIDALDETRSDLVRFPSSGRVMTVSRHEFRPDNLVGEVAFRVPQLRTLFLTGRVVQALAHVGLSGTTFKQVWEG